jgi:gliding motility-associated-like protein
VGPYTVTVRDANNCSATATVTITQPAAMTAAITAQTNPLCFGDCNGTATVTANGGTLPYAYSWCLSQITQTVSNLCNGPCGVTVTDANNCTATASVTLTQPPLLTASITAQTNPLCFGDCNGTATVTAGGGTPGYLYSWCNSQTTANATGLCDGNCIVTVTDQHSCTATATVTMVQPPQLSVTTSQTNVTCNGLCDGTATAIPAGGTPPYTYAWSGGSTPANITTGGLCAGQYTVTVRDANLCTATATVTITEPAAIVLSTSQTNVLCNGQCNGTATVTVVSGGTPPFTYTWSGGTTPNQPATGGLCVGPYTVTVRDANNCSATATVTITQPVVLTASNGGSTDVTCGGLCTGTATITVSGGTLPYGYIWDNGEITNPATALCAGSYTPTVTDANGCTATASFTISEPSAMTLDLDSTMSCGSFQTQVAGVTYLPDGTGVSYTSTINQSDFASGLTITNASQIVSICANMEHSYLGDLQITLTCPSGQSVVLKQYPGGGNTYLGEPIDLGPNADQPFPGVGYDYCWNMTPMYGTMVSEANTHFYSYTDVEGYPYTNHSYLPSGSYMPFQAFTNLVGCPVNGDWTITVTDNLAIDNGYIFSWLINFSPSIYPNQFCNGTITPTPGGGTPPYTYFWSNGATTSGVTDLCEGIYCLTVTDALGCTVSDCATIIDVDLVITSMAKTDASCNGICNGSATVNYSINGGIPVTFLWSNNETTQTINNLCAGWYKVTVSEADGCYDIDSVEVLNQYELLTDFTQTSGIVCNGQCTGAGYYSNFGGTSPYTFNWSPAVSTDSIVSNLCAGTYYFTVTDQPGCVKNDSVTFIAPPAININSVTSTNVQPCFGDNNGTITINANGGTPPLTYNIGFGPAGSGAFTNLPANTYTPTVTDAAGCSVVLPPVTITQPLQMLITSSTQVNVTPCFGNLNGEIHVVVSGGQAPLTYSIISGVNQATGDFTGLAAGNYTVTITDQLGCSLTTPVITITQPASNLIDNIATTPAGLCSSSCNGQAVITASGGTLPYQYNIGGADQLSNTFNELCAGSYGLTVTDAQNCSVTGTFDITSPPVLQIDSEAHTDISCFGANDGTITITASGGTGTLTFSNGVTSNTTGQFTGLFPNTYTITVTDANGCTALTSPITIIEPPHLLITAVNVTNVSPCFGDAGGVIEIIVSGGVPSYLYDIGPGNQPSNVFNGLTAGDYTITITDNSGCTVTTGTVTVTQPPLLTALFTEIVTVTCGAGCDGALTITPSGGVAPYTYAWSPNTADTDSSVSSLCGALYYVTVTDALGCSAVNNAEVADTNAFAVQVVLVDSISCFGLCDGEIQVLATGSNPPFTYSWSNFQTGPVVSNLCPDHYEVTITDGLGCERFRSFDLTEPPAIILSTSSTDALCPGSCDGTATVTASGGTPPFLYAWDDPWMQTLNTATGLCPNNYTVTITDANNCTAVSLPVTVSAPPVLTVSVSEDSPISCFGVCDGIITAIPAGGTAPYTYEWSPNTMDITATVTGLCAGTYEVTVSDANNCTVTGNYTIAEPSQLIAVMTDSTAIACGGGVNCTGTATVTPSGGTPGYTYQWDAQTGDQTTQTATGLCQGIFFVTVSDQGGCTAVTSVNIVDTSDLQLDTLYTIKPTCFGDCDGIIEVLATGGYPPYTYIWSDGQTGPIANGLCADTVYVTVTDDSLCARAIEVILSAPAPLTVLFTSTGPSCHNLCDGVITALPSGGTAPYTYLWNTGDNTPSISNCCCGIPFWVTVTDANGCTMEETITLAGNSPVIAGIDVNSEIQCYNLCNGSLAALPSGGLPPYTYTWTGGLTDSLLTGLCAGVYDLTVSDSFGCEGSGTYTLINPDSLEITFSNITQIPCGVGACSGTASVNATGGTAPYTYSWSNFSGTFTSTDQDLTGLCAGQYLVTVSDFNGCTQTGSIAIIDTSDLDLDTVSISHISCAGLCDGQIEVIATGGYPPYTYEWSNGQSGPVATGLCQDSYAVTVYDTQFCSREMIFDITDADVLTAVAEITPITCSGRCDGIITIHALGGTPPVVSYQWSIAGPTDSVASNLCPGWYYYTITDANGCIYNDSAEVVDPGEMIININVLSPIVCAGDCSGSLQAELGWGVYPAQYEWNNGLTDSLLTNLCAGEYILTVTDATLCSSVDTITLVQPDTLLINVTDMVEVACGGACTGSITVEGTGGVGPYTYLWDAQTGNAITPTVSNLCPDLYSVTVTDFNGCTAAMNVELTDTSDVEIIVIDSVMVTCYGLCNGSVTIDVTGGTPAYTYEWNTVPAQTLPAVTDLCAGTVQVTVTDANICSRVREFIITQPDSLYITLIDSQSVSCYGDNNGLLNIDIDGGTPVYDVLWSNSSTTQLITGLAGGTFTVTVTDQNGCQDSLEATLTEPAEIEVNMTIVNPLCSSGTGDGSILAGITGGTLPYTFLWSNDSTTQDLTGIDAGMYYLTLTDGNGCQHIDSAEVTPGIVVDAVAWKDTVICGYDSVQIYGFGGNFFIWSPVTGMSDPSVFNPWVKPGITTIYYYTAFDSICFDIDSVQISVYAPFDVEAGPDVTILYDHPTTLTGSGGTVNSTYLWVPSAGLTSDSTLVTTANPEATTMYYLFITDENGCTYMDSVKVTVLPQIFVPSGFTPNGDGMNDVWEIDMISLFPDCEVEVYNRWGEQLFYSRGYPDNQRFDGTYKGKPLPIGTYYFIINLHDEVFTEPITGPLTIMR